MGVYMKKGEMGVGTLIIFISMLLVAAVAAGVLLQTAGSLQEKSLSTGQQAKSQISTHAETVEVSATDGRNGNLTEFLHLIKLAPGSDPIKLSQVILAMNTKDYSGTLKYRGTGSVCDKNNVDGYNTRNADNIASAIGNTSATGYTLIEDLDDDGADDTITVGPTVGGATYMNVSLSSAGDLNFSLGANILDADAGVAISVTASIYNATTTFGTALVSGTTYTNNTIDAAVTVVITPSNVGSGYFAVEYEQQSDSYIEGTLQRGDMVKLCYEAVEAVNEDESVRINLIPKIGSSTTTEFNTPDVISTERVYLYP